jgi:hypothetical protein
VTIWNHGSQSSQDGLESLAPREEIESVNANAPEVPDSPLIFDITVDPKVPVVDGLPPPIPGFWQYELNITEGWDRGQPYADGFFLSVGGSNKFVFRDDGKFVWAKVNDKYLHMQYDFKNHCKSRSSHLEQAIADLLGANFAYDSYHWGMDAWSASARGMCISKTGWNKPALPVQSTDTRVCQYFLMGMKSIAD